VVVVVLGMVVVVVDVDVELVDVVLDDEVVDDVVVDEVVVDGTVVVVLVVVVDVVDVVVVVAFGITNPFAHPHRMSIGAPTGVPIVDGIASRYRRTCDQPSHAETPVVGQPPLTCEHAAVWTVMAASLKGRAIATPRAARTAHWRAWDPLWVWIWGIASTFGPAWLDTHNTSSMVHPLLQVSLVETDWGHPSAEPKFQSLTAVVAT